MKTDIYRRDRHRNIKRVFMAVAVAFALAFTLLPAVDVSADDDNLEPTLPASEMITQGSGEQPDDGDETGDEDPTTTIVPPETTTTTTEFTTEPTTESTTIVTTTINTSGKGWKTPKGKKSLSLTLCRNTDGSFFDLTAQAGQKLYDYDTLQGATAGKGYGYFSLYNRKVNKAKIVKVHLSDMKVVKVSAALDIKHANELAYNGRKNIIVVANSDPTAKRLSIINANTLTLQHHKTISTSGKIKGMSKKQRKKFQGVGAIAYNENKNCYICRMRKTNDLLFLDSNFKPTKRVKQKSKISGMLYQGLDSHKDCIMVCQSFKGSKKYNVITVYNMKGKYLARFTMGIGKPALELETVFHDGNQFYAGFYSCFGAKTDDQKLGIERVNSIYRINNL